MGYLKRLISEKEAKEKFDRDVDRMRIAIVSIESLVSLHDGEFLDDLENLLTKWKNKEK